MQNQRIDMYFIIETRISDNIVSQALVHYSQLPIEPLPTPYILDGNVKVSKILLHSFFW